MIKGIQLQQSHITIRLLVIIKLLQGEKRKCPSVDGRFPITLSILHRHI